MKIAFLSYNRDPSIPHIDNDGCPVTVRHYALELGKLGNKVHIFANNIKPDKRSSAYLRKKFKAQSEHTVQIGKNVTVIRIPAKKYSSSNHALPRESADIPEIAESFANAEYFQDGKLFQYDAVCFFHPLSIFGPLVLGYTPLEKTVIFPMLLSDEYKKYQSVSRVYEEMELFSLQKVRFVFSSSTSEKDVLNRKGLKNGSVKVIFRGFDNHVFVHRQKTYRLSAEKDIRIISVGSLKSQKQQLQLVEITKLLRKDGYRPHITIVGEHAQFIKPEYESYYNLIQRKIKSAQLESNFTFTGALDSRQIAGLFNEQDLGVYCSVSESFGKAALESICAGVPTILNTEVDAYKDFAQGGVNALFYDSSAVSCVKEIKKIIADPALYSKISKNGNKTSASFSWQNVSLQLETYLKQIPQ